MSKTLEPKSNAPPARYVTGCRAIEEFLRGAGPEAVLHAGRRTKRILAISEAARAAGIAVNWTDEKALNALPIDGEHRGLVLELRGPVSSARQQGFDAFLASFHAETGLVLALDGVTDVHNLGALVRSADLFRVDAVLVPGRRSAGGADVVARISSGASAFTPLMETPNLSRALQALKKRGFWIYGADMDGSPATETALGGRTALVLGSEGAGLSRLVRETCDALVSIPTAGHIDSFNVSVAGGILLYEIRRQQGFPY